MKLNFNFSAEEGNREPEIRIFREYLQKKGLKATSQRDEVLALFLATESHQSAEGMFQILKAKNSRVGYSTVYRTLKLLKECGLAREVHLHDGRTYYEHHYNHPHHDHMVCIGCGHTIEFYNATIEALQDRIAGDNHFLPVRHTMVIFGYCKECRGRYDVEEALGQG